MDAVVALGGDQTIAVAGLRLPLTALLLCLPALPAWAQSEDVANLVVAQASFADPKVPMQPRMEISARTLPRFDNTDGATSSSRIDMSLLAPRRSALGPSLGMTSTDGRGLSGARPFSGASPSLDLGLHWRYTLDSSYRFDVSAWRRISPVDAASLIQDREANYGARVEMHIASSSRPHSGFVADHGFRGFQLEGGGRITVRRSGGQPMIYYRTKF
jgi:hypothetical protein